MDAAFRSASPLSGRSAAGGCGSSSLSRGARSAISARRCQIFAGSNRIFESLSNSSSTSIFLAKSSSAIFISIDYYLHSYCNVLSLKDSGPLDHLRYPHRHLLPPTNSRSDDRGPSLCHWQAATFRRSSSEIARAGMAIDAIAQGQQGVYCALVRNSRVTGSAVACSSPHSASRVENLLRCSAPYWRMRLWCKPPRRLIFQEVHGTIT